MACCAGSVAEASIAQYKRLGRRGKPLGGEWTPMAAVLVTDDKMKPSMLVRWCPWEPDQSVLGKIN
jgi:hypothetical protein